MPKTVVKNCVYDFALTLNSALTNEGFCSLAPALDPGAQSFLNLADNEMSSLRHSIERLRLDCDSIGLSVRWNGEILIVLDVEVRKPRRGNYFYGINMNLVHFPTARLLSEFQKKPFNPLLRTCRCGPISQYFSTVGNDLPDPTSSYLSSDTWARHGSQVIDYYLSSIKRDILPELNRPWQAKDLLLFEYRYLEEETPRVVFPENNRFFRRPPIAEGTPNNLRLPSTADIILCVLAGYPDLGKEGLVRILENQAKIETAIPNAARRKELGQVCDGHIEYINDYFVKRFEELVASTS